MTARERWTREEDARLREIGALAMVRESSRTYGACRVRLHRLRRPSGPPAPQRRWTAEEDATLEAMRLDGCTYHEVGAALGRSYASCHARARVLGCIEQRAPDLTRQIVVQVLRSGGDLRGAAREALISYGHASKVARRMGWRYDRGSRRWRGRRRWSDAERDRLQAMLDAGRSYEEASEVLGRSPMACAHQACVRGWTNQHRWTRQEEARLLRMRAEGCSYAAIGRELGRTPNACRIRASQIGAPTRSASPRQVVEALLRGDTTQDVAERLGVSVMTVRRTARRAGLAWTRREEWHRPG